jgi:ferredoxin-NADP reductase
VPKLINNLHDHYIYICGGIQMVEDTIAALQTHKVPNEHIHAEQFT